MVRSVLYPDSWLPRSVELKKWLLRTFMEDLKSITWLHIAIISYCQRIKALTLLPAIPSLCSASIRFKVGEWTHFLHKSFFICNSPGKVREIGGQSFTVLFWPVKAQPVRNCRTVFLALGSRGRIRWAMQFSTCSKQIKINQLHLRKKEWNY